MNRFVQTTFAGIILIAAVGLSARTTHAPGPPPSSPGLTLMAEGKEAEALPLLEKECAEAPDDAGLAVARARCLLDLARWKDALAASRVLLDRFPRNPDARILAGEIFFVNFHAAEAVEAWWPLMKDPAQAGRALPRMLAVLLSRRHFGQAAKLTARARAARIPFTDEALRLAAKATPCPAMLDLLEELVRRHPDNGALKEKLRIERSVCAKGGTSLAAGSPLPASGRSSPFGSAFKVLLNGRKTGDLSFDSGSQGVNLWGPRLVKKLGLTVLGKTTTSSLGKDPVESRQVLLEHLKISGIEVSNLSATYRSSPYGRRFVRMGFGPFLDYMVEWDRRKGRITFWPAGTSAETIFGEKPDVVLPVRWYDGVPLVPVSINGRGPFPFLFDTGASNTLLTARFCPLLGLNPGSSGTTDTRGVSASGWFKLQYLTGVTLSVGGAKYAPSWIQAADVPQQFSGPVYGILGMDFIFDYRVVFDGPGCRILLQRYKGGNYCPPGLNKPEPIVRRMGEGQMPPPQVKPAVTSPKNKKK